jgi:hypothetical protein
MERTAVVSGVVGLVFFFITAGLTFATQELELEVRRWVQIGSLLCMSVCWTIYVVAALVILYREERSRRAEDRRRGG